MKAYKNKTNGIIVTAVEFKKGYAHFNIDGIRDIMEETKFLKLYEVYTNFKA